jgi:hypothetical protein
VEITEAYRIAIAYQETAVVGEKQLAGGEVVPVEAEFECAVFDSHSVEMVLRLLPLADDYVAEVPTFHAARGAEMMVTVYVLGCETVTDCRGSADAWKVQTDWGGATQCYWIGVETSQLIKQRSRLTEEVQLEFVRG